MGDLESEIKSILNLRTNESIGLELAGRQLAVIIKSYQYLLKPENRIIYIADDVGLGKTYIAAGVAMLFRHFSKDLEQHKDLIIVPKKNLQDKWKKELKNFVSKNYLPDNDALRKQYSFDDGLKDRIMPIQTVDPITIFRMTSFSSIAAKQNRKTELFDYLLINIFNEHDLAKSILTKAWELGYFNLGYESTLRKLVAYLANALSPKVNFLIIDEAHNYKYGVGDEDHEESIRNETTARFLGSTNDKLLLIDFPELRSRIKFPLAEKIICLSATPRDRTLLEIKNQFNCFTNSHILSRAKTSVDIESLLKEFMIRGNLEYTLNGLPFSRNQCRLEHRLGNVNKSEIPIPLTVEDTFESIFWQLIQYKSIKHLEQKNNASFEIGMLASFETYISDLERKVSKESENQNESENGTNLDKEYEQTVSRKIKESQDINVIKSIVSSYHEKFKTYPPHPKQTKIENELMGQLQRQEKSLIFVRRVASSQEMEKRLLERFEKEIVYGIYLDLTGKFARYKTAHVKSLVNSFAEHCTEKKIEEQLDETLKLLLEKDEIRRFYYSYDEINESNYWAKGLLWLKIAYESESNAQFKNQVNDFIRRDLTNVPQYLKEISIVAINNTYREFKVQLEDDEEIDQKSDETESGYYFSDYFKKGRKGFFYRQKMYRENWFEINPVILNNHFRFIEYAVEGLNKELSSLPSESKKKKHQSFMRALDLAYNYLNSKGAIKPNSESINRNLPKALNESTFITRLLCEFCQNEMMAWISSRNIGSNCSSLLLDLKVLNTLLRNIFRNASGLLPGFIADSTERDFGHELLNLITNIESPYYFVLTEIKSIINDFDLIVAVNFQDKDVGKINTTLRNLTPIVGTSGQDDRDRGILAAQFRMPGFPYVLITTDIFREGEDLHTYCQNIYHYGIAWNPSDMEQRTGRIDRINSKSYRMLNKSQRLVFENKVQVFYPYLRYSVEVNQVVQLLLNLNKFVETFNDITKDNPYESKVDVNKDIVYENIPAPISARLISKYDIHDFKVQ